LLQIGYIYLGGDKMSDLRRTALYEMHKKANGQIVDFSGWELPIQYSSIKEEHYAVRNKAGLFDVSHMGEVTVKGKGAFDFVQNLVTNDVSKLENNQILYAMMCYETGGIVDDLLVYKYTNDNFYLVINASNVEKDFDWMVKNSEKYDIELVNISKEISEIAIQGPNAQKILQKIINIDLDEIKFFYFKDEVLVNGKNALVSRTGYTGEDGFEIYVSNGDVSAIWEKLFEVGEADGLVPTGLGARDTLRFEASLPLYGNELSKDITPLEASLGFFVKLEGDDFIGKSILVKQKEEGLTRKTIGFELLDNGIPRHGYDVYADDKKIGSVSTGYKSPTLKKSIGLALIDIEYTKLDTEIYIEVRNKMKKAKVVSRRFYKKNYKK
jgi:aminomethyltransferase